MRKYWLHLQRKFDLWEFKKHQADYFLYLSQLLKGTKGQYTVRSIFAADVQRYGLSHYRGRLAHYWLGLYQKNGGDLALTWQSSLSSDTWLLLKISQDQGDQALVEALSILAEQLREQKQLYWLLIQLFWPVGFALALFSLMLLFVPWFTVPQLQQTFHAVSAQAYGGLTQKLFAWSAFSQRYGGWFLGVVFIAVISSFYALPRYQGRLRKYLDYLEPWRSYKAWQGLQVLILLSLLLQRGSRQLRLAQALQHMQRTPNHWLKAHLQSIQKRMIQGQAGAASFADGLFPQDLIWFMSDMEKSQGIVVALSLSADYWQGLLTRRLSLEAQLWRWGILLSCVMGLLLLGGWHYVVIDELRQALLMQYAS